MICRRGAPRAPGRRATSTLVGGGARNHPPTRIPGARCAPLLLLVIACSHSVTPPARQNPSPMVESARPHQRVEKSNPAGIRFTLDNVLPKPVAVFVPAQVHGNARL